VCSVVKAELIFGARKSRDFEQTRRVQQAFLEPLSRDLVLVTHNVGEFARVPGLTSFANGPAGGTVQVRTP